MKLSDLFHSDNVKKAFLLYSATIIGLPLGIITSILITRYLGAQQYGDFKFINGVFTFAVLIVNLGFFYAGNRAFVLNDDKEKRREYYGALLVIAAGLFLLMSAGLVVYALLDNNMAQKNLTDTMLCLIPCGSAYLLTNMWEAVLPADRQINMLSMIRLSPKIGYVIGAAALYFLLSGKTSNGICAVFAVYVITQLLTYAYLVFKLNPSLKNFRTRLKEIFGYCKSYGFDVYTGSVFAVGASALTDILISYFSTDNTGVGFYSLALTFSLPLSFVPSTIATTRYKDFSIQRKIPTKLILITFGLSFLSMLAIWCIIPPFIKYFYGPEFTPVITLNILVSFGVIAHGMSDFFNRFIASKGKGKLLRNASILVGMITLLVNCVFISQFGAKGAAYAKILSGLSYFVIIYVCYRKTIKSGQ